MKLDAVTTAATSVGETGDLTPTVDPNGHCSSPSSKRYPSRSTASRGTLSATSM